jgi:long-chain fatty acid transport protein
MIQKRLVTTLVYLLFGARLAFPSAFAINELGARAQGMGGAFTSIADDASAIFYNPAGIAFQKGTQLEMDSLVVVGLFRFFPSDSPPGSSVPSNGYSGSIKPHFIPVANLYLTKSLSRKLTVGFGSFTPFGLSANFTNFNDQDPAGTKYVGRFAGTRARLESFWIQPTLGYQLSDNASLGVGIALVHTHLMLESSLLNPYGADTQAFGKALAPAILPGVDPEAAGRAIARLLPEGRSRIAGTSNSPGFSVGFLGKLPRKKTQIGLSFRSAVTHHLKGKASFAFTSTGSLTPFLPSPDTIAKLFPTQDVVGSFTTPASYTVGISNSSFWNTTLSFDFELQDFKRFASIPLNFSQTTNTATPAEQRLNFDFHNSYLVHAGIEKKLKRITAVRAGYLYDHTPVPDKSVGPFFPDSDRHSFTVGATQRVKNMELTLFYQFMQMIDRTVNVAANASQFTNGDYRNSAHLAGAGLRMYIGRQDR